MNTYLIVAYAIFCLAPLGLAASIALRRRRIERKASALRADLGASARSED